MTARPVEIGEIAGMMNDDAEAIALELLPGASRQGGGRIIARDLLGEPGDNMSIHLAGATRGRWVCYAGAGIGGAPDRGDMLDLAAWVLFAGDKGQALRWGLQRFGFSDAGPETAQRLAARRAQAAAARERRQAEQARRDERRMGEAFHQWRVESRPILADGATPAAAYLAGRGIDLARIPSLGALRFHPGIAPQVGDPLAPCMVSIMVDAEGKARACHRTALEILADGSVVKSRRVQSAKTIMGRPKGCFVAINRGQSDKTMANAPEGDRLLIAEGIEDALTLAMARPDLRVVAAGTLGLMGDVAPPKAISEIILYRDDDDRPTARQAFDRVLARQIERAAPLGRTIRVASPPRGFKDANDALLGKAKAKGTAA